MRQQRCTTKSVSKCHKMIFSFSGSSCNKLEHDSKKHVCLTFSIVHHIYNQRKPNFVSDDYKWKHKMSWTFCTPYKKKLGVCELTGFCGNGLGNSSRTSGSHGGLGGWRRCSFSIPIASNIICTESLTHCKITNFCSNLLQTFLLTFAFHFACKASCK
jgi:hypothetical protein